MDVPGYAYDWATEADEQMKKLILAALLAAMCGVLARSRANAFARQAEHRVLPAADLAVVVLAGGVATMAGLELIAILRS